MTTVTAPSYFHRGGETPLLGVPIDTFFRGVAARGPEREALVSIPQGVRLRYADLDAAVQRVARGLVGLGIGHGDAVAIWSTNNVEWITVQLAAARIGAVLVNLNPAYRKAELEHALRTAKVHTIVLIPSFRSSPYLEMLLEVCPELAHCEPGAPAAGGLPHLRHAVVYDPEDAAATTRPARGVLAWPDLLERAGAVSDEAVAARTRAVDPDHAADIQFTSGTTGRPKPVVLTHHSILNNAFFAGEALGFTERDRLCVPVPFYHCFGMVVAGLACLTHGAAVVIPSPHFDAEAALAAVEGERCTALHGVPTMFIAEMERPEFGSRDLSTLRTGIMGGAPCPPELLRRVIGEMGCREILVAYGQTESSPLTHVARPTDSLERRTTTVGTSLPHQEVKIVDAETGEIVPLGTPGEICFRGYHVMRGYLDQPAATRAAIDDAGWLHSGDLGVMDAEGYLRITGRLKEMIIRGGENIYPAEVEAFFHEHPKIAAISVFGVPDPVLGEDVAAWIKVHDDTEAEPEEFRAWAKGQIAHYKIPRYVELVDTFPMTATGKVQKFRMREMFVAAHGATPADDPVPAPGRA